VLESHDAAETGAAPAGTVADVAADELDRLATMADLDRLQLELDRIDQVLGDLDA
jgi:hypothetical protein